eukprot:gene20164-34311_t
MGTAVAPAGGAHDGTDGRTRARMSPSSWGAKCCKNVGAPTCTSQVEGAVQGSAQCHDGRTYEHAAQMCAGHEARELPPDMVELHRSMGIPDPVPDWRLCRVSEVRSGLCCNTGCDDTRLAWVDEDPTAAPTPTPEFRMMEP